MLRNCGKKFLPTAKPVIKRPAYIKRTDSASDMSTQPEINGINANCMTRFLPNVSIKTPTKRAAKGIEITGMLADVGKKSVKIVKIIESLEKLLLITNRRKIFHLSTMIPRS